MKSRSLLRRSREAALTLGAVAGSLCLLMLVLGAVADVRPLVFRSGSMSPAIDTGDLAVVRTVPAGDLETGDIVSVVNAQGDRVTHRLVRAVPRGDRYDLTLQGDANPGPDAETYTVSDAEKVEFSVPALGRVIAAMSSPGGLVVVGGLGVLLVGIAFRGGARGPGGPRREPTHRQESGREIGPSRARIVRRVVVGAGTAVAVTCVAGGASATPWTDGATFQAALSAHKLAPPVSTSCSSALLSATVSWPEADSRYDYEVTLQRGTNVISTRQVTGSNISTTYTGLLDFGLLSLGLGTFDFTVQIRSYLAAKPQWTSDAVITHDGLRVVKILVGATASCI